MRTENRFELGVGHEDDVARWSSKACEKSNLFEYAKADHFPVMYRLSMERGEEYS